MKKYLFFLFLLFPIYLSAQEEFEYTEGDTTYVMKKYWFCLLTAGPERSQDSATVMNIQRAHLAHLDEMAEAGKLVVAGPFADDGNWRGILIFNAKNEEEVRTLVEQDPAVKAGRLAYEIHPWWTAKGTCFK
jgi:uncharacterized protein YciI